MAYKTCNECDDYIDENQMISTTGKLCYHAEVCPVCFENLENDEE